jgi:hypothetical protein
VAQNFFDCLPLDTFTATTAMEACVAYALSQGGTAANCGPGWTCPSLPSDPFVCYADTAQATCLSYCWNFSGAEAGWVSTCASCTTQVGTWR